MNENLPSSLPSGGRTFTINPVVELLTAYAIVHRDMSGKYAREWAETQWPRFHQIIEAASRG